MEESRGSSAQEGSRLLWKIPGGSREGSRWLKMMLRVFWKLSRDSSRCMPLGLTIAIPSSGSQLMIIDADGVQE